MSEPNVQMVSQITLSGAIKLCAAIGQSEDSHADDFKHIAEWLKDYQNLRTLMNNKALAEISESEWVNPGDLNIYKCNVCDEVATMMSQFCPHCGSFMKNGK